MLRRLPVFFALFASTVVFAQGYGRGSVHSGFGSVLFPGTGGPPPARVPGAITDTTFGGRLGASVRGYPGRSGVVRGAPHPSHGRQVIVPVPIIIGGGGYPYDAMGNPAYYQQPEQVQQPTAPPVVILNQGYRPEPPYAVVREQDPYPPATVRRYDAPGNPMPDPSELSQNERPARRTRASDEGRAAAPPLDDSKPTIYLIAFKDHTILPSLAYWVEGDTLNYISQQGTPNQVSLTLVDRDFSRQLNRERQVEFTLP